MKMLRTMNSPSPPNMEEILQLKNNLGTKVHPFMQNLTAEQWELLKTCSPDYTTRVQIAELLLQIVQTLSNVFLTTAWKSIFTDEDIKASLGNLVTDTFKMALDIKDDVQCESADNLLKLINKEVADTVNSALSNDSESEVSSIDLAPKRLHMMVVHAVKMMNNFLVRVKKIVTYRSAKMGLTTDLAKWDLVLEDVEDLDLDDNTEEFPFWDQVKDEDEEDSAEDMEEVTPWGLVDVEDEEDLVDDTDEVMSGEPVEVEDNEDLEEPSSSEMIGMKLDEIIEPEMLDSQFDGLTPSSPPEDNINLDVVQDGKRSKDNDDRMEGGDHCNIFESESTLRKKKETFIQVVIEKLFSRIFSQNQDGTIKENKDILQRLFVRTCAEVEGIDFVLSQKNLENLDKIIFKDMCNTLGGADQVLQSLKKEDEVLMDSIARGFKLCVAPETNRTERIGNCFSSVYRAIFRRGHQVSVKDPVENVEEIPLQMMAPIRDPTEMEEESEDTTDRTEGGEHCSVFKSQPPLRKRRRTFMEIIIEKLFSRIFYENEDYAMKENKDILVRLVERTWIEIQVVDFELSKKNLKNLDKSIFKDMCKRLGSVDQVLLSLKKEDEVVVNIIVYGFNRSVALRTNTTKRIGNFFSSVYRAIFRRGHHVDVKDPVENTEEIPFQTTGPIRAPTEMEEESEDTTDRTKGSEYSSVFESKGTLMERKETFIEIIIQKLFSRIFYENQDYAIKENKDILMRLIERTKVEVKVVDIDLSKENLENLDNIMFKDMCKRLGGADQVLQSLKREDEVLMDAIVAGFNCSVAPETKRTKRIGNCFSSVYRAIVRRGHQVNDKDPVENTEEIPLQMMAPITVPTEMEEEPSSNEIKSDSHVEDIINLNVVQEEQQSEHAADMAEGGDHCRVSDSETTLRKKKETFVEIVIERLFSRILNEELYCTITKPQDILFHLFERTWAEVEGVDFELSLKKLKNLDRMIFKDLCKKLGSPDQVLMSLRMEDEALIHSIVSFFNLCRKSQTKKIDGVGSFFSFVYQAIFRRRQQDDLI